MFLKALTLVSALALTAFAVEPAIETAAASAINVERLQAVVEGQIMTGSAAYTALSGGNVNKRNKIPVRVRRVKRQEEGGSGDIVSLLSTETAFCSTYLGYPLSTGTQTQVVWTTQEGDVATSSVTRTVTSGEAWTTTVTDTESTAFANTVTITGLVHPTETVWPTGNLRKRDGFPSFLSTASVGPEVISSACSQVVTPPPTPAEPLPTTTVTKTRVLPESTVYVVHVETISGTPEPATTVTVPGSGATATGTKTVSVKACATKLPSVNAAGTDAEGAILEAVEAEDEGDCCGACYEDVSCTGWFWLSSGSVCHHVKADTCGKISIFAVGGTAADAAGPGCGTEVRQIQW